MKGRFAGQMSVHVRVVNLSGMKAFPEPHSQCHPTFRGSGSPWLLPQASLEDSLAQEVGRPAGWRRRKSPATQSGLLPPPFLSLSPEHTPKAHPPEGGLSEREGSPPPPQGYSAELPLGACCDSLGLRDSTETQ